MDMIQKRFLSLETTDHQKGYQQAHKSLISISFIFKHDTGKHTTIRDCRNRLTDQYYCYQRHEFNISHK